MKNEHLERWQHLAARVAAEQDPAQFTRLVKELLEELRLKEERLKGRSDGPASIGTD